MSAPDRAKLVEELLARLARRFGEPAEQSADAPAPLPADDCLFHGDEVLREFVRSFLMWDAPSSRVQTAMDRIRRACVDINEFRVCLLDEMAQIIGTTYPGAADRCERLRAALNEIYKREHSLKLAHLASMSKREARAYLESLGPTPPYVVARVGLMRLGMHAIPVDERLLERLVESRVIEPGATLDAAQSVLERAIRAADGAAVRAHRLLQAWADEGVGVRLVGARRPARRATAKKATGERPARKRSKP